MSSMIHQDAKTIVKAPDLEIPFSSCLMEKRPEPCQIVIMGASGDLTARKLLPALYQLYLKGALPDPFLIIGCARTEMNDERFRTKIGEALSQQADFDRVRWHSFASCLLYRKVQYEDPSSFQSLAESLQELDSRFHTEGNRIFYFAIPPALYHSMSEMLGRAGLSSEQMTVGNTPPTRWTRIVVEKPFGRDLQTAIDLDNILHQYFNEQQIFRIDHYLAKETVQNLLMFRFANAIFEPVWNRQYIDSIEITAAETIGVEHRAGYYEQAGVIRDMFQNHMMQLLALTAMEAPSLFEADRVRDEKVKVYRSLRPFPVNALGDNLILGQYEAGIHNGHEFVAYRDEPDVAPDSLTPTFACMKIFLDNWRWQGVPFFLTSGKRLAKKLTQIAIQFKAVPHSMFRHVLGEHITANRLILGIYPEEKITLTFQTKYPGAQVSLRSVTMDFQYNQNYEGPILEAYQKVLLDCMLGDHMLFWRQDGVELCWAFLTPIINKCETCGDRKEMLLSYAAGSWGPDAVRSLVKGSGSVVPWPPES